MTPCELDAERPNFFLRDPHGRPITASRLTRAQTLCIEHCPRLEWCRTQRPESGTVQAGLIYSETGAQYVTAEGLYAHAPVTAGRCNECNKELPVSRSRYCSRSCSDRAKRARARAREARTLPAADACAALLAGQAFWDTASGAAQDEVVRQLHAQGLYDTEIAAIVGTTTPRVRGVRARRLGLPGHSPARKAG